MSDEMRIKKLGDNTYKIDGPEPLNLDKIRFKWDDEIKHVVLAPGSPPVQYLRDFLKVMAEALERLNTSIADLHKKRDAATDAKTKDDLNRVAEMRSQLWAGFSSSYEFACHVHDNSALFVLLIEESLIKVMEDPQMQSVPIGEFWGFLKDDLMVAINLHKTALSLI